MGPIPDIHEFRRVRDQAHSRCTAEPVVSCNERDHAIWWHVHARRRAAVEAEEQAGLLRLPRQAPAVLPAAAQPGQQGLPQGGARRPKAAHEEDRRQGGPGPALR